MTTGGVPVETTEHWIARQLASAPPLNAEQREVIRRALAVPTETAGVVR